MYNRHRVKLYRKATTMTIAQLYEQFTLGYATTKAEKILNISKNDNGTYEVQTVYRWYTAKGDEYVIKVR